MKPPASEAGPAAAPEAGAQWQDRLAEAAAALRSTPSADVIFQDAALQAEWVRPKLAVGGLKAMLTGWSDTLPALAR